MSRQKSSGQFEDLRKRAENLLAEQKGEVSRVSRDKDTAETVRRVLDTRVAG